MFASYYIGQEMVKVNKLSNVWWLLETCWKTARLWSMWYRQCCQMSGNKSL